MAEDEWIREGSWELGWQGSESQNLGAYVDSPRWVFGDSPDVGQLCILRHLPWCCVEGEGSGR